MNTQRYYYTVEFVPDNPDRDGDEFDCVGTYEEARAFAERFERDYLCKEIAFHRKGEHATPQPFIVSREYRLVAKAI